MFIAENFIFIHFPKAGGTFVTKMLERCLDESCKLYTRVNIDKLVPHSSQRYGQHGGCNEIPEGWATNRKIVSIIRNPFDSLVSRYEFKWWQTHPPVDRNIILSRFPHYPELTIDEYLEMVNTIFLGKTTPINGKQNIGSLTAQFIRFYFKNPYRVMTIIDDEYIDSGQYKKDMYDVHFLRMERLNSELNDFLISIGFSPETTSFILNHPKIFPREGGRSENQRWVDYYTPELKNYVKSKERLLFKLFPEYDA